jgi:hypothetical protein
MLGRKTEVKYRIVLLASKELAPTSLARFMANAYTASAAGLEFPDGDFQQPKVLRALL